MASSVSLRACGGLPPYTWSKTGNISLLNTTGTRVTVIVLGSGAGIASNFLLTATSGALSCTTGTCATYGNGGAYAIGGSPNWQVRTTDCNGNTVTGCGVSNPNITLGSTNVNCSPDCTGTLVITANGSCTGAGGSCSASGLIDTITLTCGSASGILHNTDILATGVHEYLIIDGGGSIGGATVTVTDAAGISVTHVF